MKLTTFILMISLMQVSAASFGQKLTMKQNNVAITDVFFEIRKQTGFDILIENTDFKKTRRINADFNNTPLEDVMKEIVKGSNLIYKIEDKTVLIKEKENSFIDLVSEKLNSLFQQKDSLIFQGYIIDEKGKPMPGASIKNKETNLIARSAATGAFAVRASNKGTLIVSYVGFITREITLAGLNPKESLKVVLTPGQNELGQVDVVSTGYYQLPKERATGSFEVITKEQLQHSSDPNLIRRLDGITTSMDFRNDLNVVNSAVLKGNGASTIPGNSPIANLTIRGKNTLNINQTSFNNNSGSVLVVIDGVPSPYPIDNVNPDNVENITVLKDAAAASIWGSRAANGVIVVTTKRGNFEKPVNVSFNTGFNIQKKPDLFYRKLMNTSDFIDAQIFQFNMANTNVAPPTVNTLPTFLSPVAEIMNQKKRGEISPEVAAAKLDALRGNDIRNDYNKYVNRNAIIQRYSLGLNGGSKKMAWSLFGGYDKNRANTIGAGDNKVNLNYNTSFKPFKNLAVNAGVTYTIRSTENQDPNNPSLGGASIAAPYYLYTRLADDQGNPLSIPYKYRPSFAQLLATTYGGLIPDLTYTPLTNINESHYKTTFKNLNFSVGAKYKINNILSASLNYNYGVGDNLLNQLSGKNSFYVRDLVAYFTSPGVPASNGIPASAKGTQAIPNNSILNRDNQSIHNQTLQGALNLDKSWGDKHALNIIAGMDATRGNFSSYKTRDYGYDEKFLSTKNDLNYKDALTTLYRKSTFISTDKIPFQSTAITDINTRTISMYANGAYTYNRRYTISGSIRKDMTSDFGIGYNKSGTPFFSVGGKWNIAEEDFYKVSWLPMLSLRTTFGYNGNSNPLVLPFAQIGKGGGQENDMPYAFISSGATNNQLRPEKTGVLNLGLDFGVKNGRISGNLDFYNKRTTDLITGNTVDLTTGSSIIAYNTASLNTYGIDFNLSTINVKAGLFSWNSGFLLSYNRVKVTKLFTPTPKTALDVILGSSYNLGADLQRIYGFRWAGLDPATGRPMGYDINGQPTAITVNSFSSVANLPLSTAQYFGSAVPVYYGSFRNTIQYGQLSVSVNIQYMLDYYFRRQTNNLALYNSLLVNNQPTGAEYAQRWQKPGDEAFTIVPAQIYPVDNNADIFYQNADINVQKGDHVRLQEVNLSYAFGKKSWFVKNPRISVNMPVNVILWRANKLGLDPNTADYPVPRTYSFGFSANF